jgi:hypothetical protein
MGKSLLG